MGGRPSSSVVIATRNRTQLVRRAIQSVLDQTTRADIFVVDDGSADGTAGMIQTEFPEVNLRAHTKSEDVAVRRNELARWAPTDIIFFLDDDAVFSSPLVIEQTVQAFDDPRIAAVAIPFIDVNGLEIVRQRAPQPNGAYVTSSFFGGMVAFRRRVFTSLGGYRSSLIHQFEEADLAIRLLDAGYVIRLGLSDPIHHFVSPIRDRRRMGIYGARNNVLFAWQNVPTPYLLPHILGTSGNSLLASFRKSHRRPDWTLIGLLYGYAGCVARPGARRPVRVSTYRLSRELKQRNGLLLQEIEPRLPAVETPLHV
jgi:glycosyltransferase involved in cell wall biosynthesis